MSALNKGEAAKADLKKIEELRVKRAVPEHRVRSVFAHQLPRVLPAGWNDVTERTGFGIDGRAYRNHQSGLSFIVSLAYEDDGKEWFHYSVAHPSRLPTYQEVYEVKDLFCGRENKAVMVLPPRAEHVNIHNFALHFFRCLEGDGLPDFTAGTRSL